MKNKYLLLLFAIVLGLASCSDSDDSKPNLFKLSQNDLKGTIESGSTVSLKSATVYKLTGKLLVQSGATLNIPAGVRIEATATSASDKQVRYIAVEQGAKININGTASSPVVMSSEKKESAAWGGLVICGYAPTNKADAGSAGAEVSELKYGGDKINDNSGVIQYLRLEYTGYKYSDSKEFNGLSLFGVGAGTSLHHIVSYEGGDDGIEFFGGTVNASYLVSVNSGDDGIDYADGWSGTGEYWVVLNAAKSGIEGSNNGDNGAAQPMTNAKLNNISIYGCGEKPYYFKEGAGKVNISNMLIGALAESKEQAYLYANIDANDTDKYDSDTHDRFKAGDILIQDIKFVDMKAGQSKAVSGINFTEDMNADGAGNGVGRPNWVSDALNTIDAENTVFGDAVKTLVSLNGDIESDMTLSSDVIYSIDGPVIVKEGSSLTIPEGTVLIASTPKDANDKVRYIAVERGAQIFVNGTASRPVVMTSEKEEAEAWGGLVICGNAATNKSDAGSAGAEVSGLMYGGNNNDDNSGSIKYLRLEYTGYKYTNDKEFNGLSLFGVGSATTIDYIMSYMGGDDGIEFFGGAVNASHLISIKSGDDGIDFADGWSGTGEYWYILDAAKSGIEGSNNGDNGAASPMTDASLRNISVFGCGEKPYYMKEGAGKHNVDNIVIGGLADNAADAYFYFKSSDSNASQRVSDGDILIKNANIIEMGVGNTAKSVSPLTISENPSAIGAGNGKNKPAWISDAFNTAYNGSTIIK
ncbi:MAG: hypothetical protein N4A49_15095 [Marinifilaceae bacterium]|nr:hypothetical protein [Marinifilaceae bacterium]